MMKMTMMMFRVENKIINVRTNGIYKRVFVCVGCAYVYVTVFICMCCLPVAVTVAVPVAVMDEPTSSGEDPAPRQRLRQDILPAVH